MNIEEKKKLLKGFCENRDDCVSCPLKDRPDIDCCNFFECSDDAVEKAYNLVFGEEINHPDRYAGDKFECIDVMLDVFGADVVKHFCILNAFKYLWRSEKKNGIEDIKRRCGT